MRQLTFIAIILSNCIGLKASHIVGGEIYYTFDGKSGNNNNYTVTLNLFVDCNNGNPQSIDQDKTASFNVFRVNQSSYSLFTSYSLSNSRTGPVRVSDISYKCIKNIPDVCVDKYTYTVKMSLPSTALGYVVTFERCCRNSTTNNILNPGTTGATYWTKIPGSNLVSSDNSPQFKYTPPTFICLNAPLTFDHGAIDKDGDSLVYELYTPYEGASRNNPIPRPSASTNPANFSTISWSSAGGYSVINQIDGNPSLTINSKTGKLSLTPTVAGQYVIGIKVLEYRNGVLIGETKRDVQFNAITCVFEVVSSFYLPSVLCAANELSILNQSQGATSYSWDFGVPTRKDDTSNLKSPKYKYDTSGTFEIRLVARTSKCADTFYNDVFVKKNFKVVLPKDTLYCGKFSKTLSSNISNKSKLWNTGDTGVSISVNKQGVYWLKVSDDPCVSVDSIVIVNDLSKVSIGKDSVICSDQFKPFKYFGPTGYISYEWNTGQRSDTLSVDKPGVYWLQTVNSNQCLSSDTIDIIDYSPPVFDIRDTVFCRNTTVTLDALNLNTATQAESKYLWSNGSGNSNIIIGSTGQFSVLVNNRYCSRRDTAVLTYIQTGLELGPDTFYCGPVNRTVYAQTNFLSYLWQDGSTNSYDQASLPGKYRVTIVSKDGCIESDSMMIIQYPVLDPGLGDDTTVCISSEIYLTAADGMSSYLWNNGATTQKISAMEKGRFIVTVSNSQGCIASDSVLVSTDPNAVPNELFMPDAFTPNDDGTNDVFPSNRYNNLNSYYKLKIYNRWGEKLFETQVTGVQWDGTYNGQLAPQDVYVYMVSSVGCDGQERQFRGTFNLLR